MLLSVDVLKACCPLYIDATIWENLNLSATSPETLVNRAFQGGV